MRQFVGTGNGPREHPDLPGLSEDPNRRLHAHALWRKRFAKGV